MVAKEEAEPEALSTSTFRRCVEITKTLLDSGGAVIRFGPARRIRLIVKEEALPSGLLDDTVTPEVLKRAVASEIAPSLAAILSDSEGEYLSLMGGRGPAKDEESVRALREKLELVRSALVSPQLKSRGRFHSTTSNLAKTLSWEVVVRQMQHEGTDLVPVPYAKIQVELYQPWKTGNPLFMILEGLGRSGADDAVSFHCEIGVLDELIEGLKAAREALTKVSS